LLKTVVDAGVPALVFFAMVVVGMELTAEDFRRVARRNVGIATAIAVTVLGRVEFAVFATAYFLSQVPILLAAVLVFRYTRFGDEYYLMGADHR
jgi:ACR3 family arsenite efflux pump ArsB